MPGSLTTPGCPSIRVVPDHIAFRYLYSVGTQDIPIATQWLACASPTDASALPSRLAMPARGRRGSHSFIVSDFHRLLLASIPARRDSNS